MKRIILYIPILLIILSACEEKIDLKLDDDFDRLVVEAALTDQDTTQKVVLSETTSYFTDEQTPRVSNAIVTISDGQNTFTFSESSQAGIYYSDYTFAGEYGKTYTLNIELAKPINDNTSYTASETMPVSLQLDSVTAEILPNPFGDRDVQVKGYGQEPASPGNYYVWDLFVNGKNYTDTLEQKTFTDDALVNGSYIPGLPIFFYDGNDKDSIKVVTQSITKEYYDFLLAYVQEAAFGGGGFSGPPANVKGNLSGGALGYFAVKAVTYNQTIYRKQ